MPDERGASEIVQETGGASIDVGANQRNPITGRIGAMLIRTVSIFLTNGRRVSVNNSKRQQSSTYAEENLAIERNRDRRRRMHEEAARGKIFAHQAKIIDALKKKTRFTRIELESLCKIYRKLTTIPAGHCGTSTVDGKIAAQSAPTIEGIDRTIFREILHNTFDVITEDTLIERMFCCWDRESEGSIRFHSWIMGLDIFLRGSIRERTEFCFRIYDLNNDGFITKDEMFQLLKNCLIKQPGEEDPDEGVRDLSELALKKLDVDHDGRVSFRDYESAIKSEPLLLEAFGQCLPTEESCQAFILTLQP